MFGRPKAASGLFLSQEVGRGMEIIGSTLERDHPDATSADFQTFCVWIYAVLIHIIMTHGRTDRNSLENVAYAFSSAMMQAPPEGRWSLDKYAEEIERCQQLLIGNVGSNNWGGLREAAKAFHQRQVNQGEQLDVSEDDFVRIGSTIGMAWVQRLRESGHVKLR